MYWQFLKKVPVTEAALRCDAEGLKHERQWTWLPGGGGDPTAEIAY